MSKKAVKKIIAVQEKIAQELDDDLDKMKRIKSF